MLTLLIALTATSFALIALITENNNHTASHGLATTIITLALLLAPIALTIIIIKLRRPKTIEERHILDQETGNQTVRPFHAHNYHFTPEIQPLPEPPNQAMLDWLNDDNYHTKNHKETHQ